MNRPVERSPADELAARQQLTLGARQSALNTVLDLHKVQSSREGAPMLDAEKFITECKKIEAYILEGMDPLPRPTIVRVPGMPGH